MNSEYNYTNTFIKIFWVGELGSRKTDRVSEEKRIHRDLKKNLEKSKKRKISIYYAKLPCEAIFFIVTGIFLF